MKAAVSNMAIHYLKGQQKQELISDLLSDLLRMLEEGER